MIFDLIIVGGGSSGVFTYLTYKEKHPNKNVLIIESNNQLLRKLSCSGNGKCNFTNEYLSFDKYNNGENFKFLFDNNPKERILSFFKKRNILYYKDEEGRYYPYSNSAKSIQKILINEIDENDYILDTKVIDIKYNNSLFYIESYNKEKGYLNFISKNLLIATGNKNYKTLGSDGSLFNSIKELGHTFTEIYPSNIYIKVKEKDITARLNGLRFKANLSLYNDNKYIYSESGELLMKENALSGIVSFNISSRLAKIYKDGNIKNPYIEVDFLYDYNELDLKDNYNSSNEKYNYLLGLIHPEMVKIIENENNPIKRLKSFRFNIVSLGDFDHAQVACGGINTKELNGLESKIIKGLYFVGDILDIDAPCGGYNLSNAFLSGMKVGEVIE